MAIRPTEERPLQEGRVDRHGAADDGEDPARQEGPAVGRGPVQRLAEDRLAAWRLLLETHSALTTRLARELSEERGLPLTWYDVLVRLSEAEGGRLRMQDLVGSLLLSKSGISRLVDRMEMAGLIARQSCPSDRRGQFAVLTDSGRATLRRAAPVHMRGIQQHFAAHLDDADVAALCEALGKLRAAHPAPRTLPPCGE